MALSKSTATVVVLAGLLIVPIDLPARSVATLPWGWEELTRVTISDDTINNPSPTGVICLESGGDPGLCLPGDDHAEPVCTGEWQGTLSLLGVSQIIVYVGDAAERWPDVLLTCANQGYPPVTGNQFIGTSGQIEIAVSGQVDSCRYAITVGIYDAIIGEGQALPEVSLGGCAWDADEDTVCPGTAITNRACSGKVFYCSADRWGGLGGVSEYDLCRSVNSALGYCNQNGDCTCDMLVAVPGDSDGDGVQDSSDVDDDCDNLADDLEAAIGTNPLGKNDPFDLRPHDDTGIRIRVALKGIWDVVSHDGIGGGNSDPYADKVYVNLHSPDADEATMLGPYEFPKFKKTDHPSNVGDWLSPLTGDWYTYFETEPLRDSFTAITPWTWRTDSLNPAKSFPNIGTYLTLFDDDGSASGDDPMGSTKDLMGSLYDIAGRTKDGANYKVVPKVLRQVATSDLKLNLQVSADVCLGAVVWAHLVSQGDYSVDLAQVGVDIAADCGS